MRAVRVDRHGKGSLLKVVPKCGFPLLVELAVLTDELLEAFWQLLDRLLQRE